MTRAILLATLLLFAPLLAGCLADDPAAPETAGVVAGSAEEAGAKSGASPVAPKDAYLVEAGDGSTQEMVAYPVPIQTNAAREPVTIDFSGEFAQGDCRPLNFGPFEEVLGAASVPRRWMDLSDQLKVGDVFSYEITLAYTNAADNWGEIHPAYGFGSTIQEHDESTQTMTDVVISWAGQGFRASDEDMAWIFVGCQIGQMSRAIPYTYTVTLTFADSAIPAEAPLLLPVPEGATTLIVRGVPIDPEQGVLSHFRLFSPDEEVVCECALSSADEVTSVSLPGPGDYVLLVDHTANGFIGVALDVKAQEPMRALASEWVATPVFSADGGPVDTTVDVNFDRVPLFMGAGVVPKAGAGVGKRTELTLTNGRGTPLHVGWGGHVTWDDPVGGQAWLGFWPGDWAWEIDHHAFAPGGHAAAIRSENLRGEVVVFTRQYVR